MSADTTPLYVARRVDAMACWLVDHGRYRLAEYLWRAFRLW